MESLQTELTSSLLLPVQLLLLFIRDFHSWME